MDLTSYYPASSALLGSWGLKAVGGFVLPDAGVVVGRLATVQDADLPDLGLWPSPAVSQAAPIRGLTCGDSLSV
jgi:hypothetical protein